MNERGIYWLIPTDNRLLKSMRDIRVDSLMILNVMKISSYINIAYGGYIYISVHDNIWDYASTNNKYDGNDVYKQLGYHYMGRVNINDMEINIKKYNI